MTLIPTKTALKVPGQNPTPDSLVMLLGHLRSSIYISSIGTVDTGRVVLFLPKGQKCLNYLKCLIF